MCDLKHVGISYHVVLEHSRKEVVTFEMTGQATSSLGLAIGIALRKLVRNAALDIVDGMAQLLEVLLTAPSQR